MSEHIDLNFFTFPLMQQRVAFVLVFTQEFLHGLIEAAQCDNLLGRKNSQKEQETEYCKKIANVSSYLGAAPAPRAMCANKGLVRNGFGQGRVGSCAVCEVFNASNSCHCSRPGYERNLINKVIGSQMNLKNCRRRKQ